MIDRETIKKLALDTFSRGQLEALTYWNGDNEPVEYCSEVFDFAERLFAEWANGGKPVAWMDAFGEPQKQRDDTFRFPLFAEWSKGSEPVAWYDPKDFTRTTSRPTDKETEPLYTRPQPAIPETVKSAIESMLVQLMDLAVANGANSVSMPDEYVEVAAWLCNVKLQPAIPPGWRLVPEAPTKEMLQAAYHRDRDGTTPMYHKVWAAMLQAAPEAPK